MSSVPAAPRKFAAMRYVQYRWYFGTFLVAMMADNIEHVISYWMLFQRFHSPALGGFAVVSHWLPFLFFSVPIGALADRVDPRRLVQCGMVLFISVSLGWSYFFLTGTLQIWEAMVLLVIHGCAGVLWQTPGQLVLHALVEKDDLQSAVRLNSTAMYLGILVGPVIGGLMLIGLGPTRGIFLNSFYFLPVIIFMWRVRFRREAAGRAAVRGFDDIVRTLGEIAKRPAIVTVSILAAAASAFIGNSYQAQMPNFAVDFGHGNPGIAYSALLAADAAGALTAGFVLETMGGLRTVPRTAIVLAMGWCCALLCFALTSVYAVALVCLFTAGFFELSFSSIAQTVVQLQAPGEIRGRVIGVYFMGALGCRAFAGVSVGLTGALLGVHHSLAIAAGTLFFVLCALLLVNRTRAAPASP